MAKATKTNGRGFTRGLEHYDALIPARGAAKRSVPTKIRKLTTTVTFSSDDLAGLADYIAAGMIMLRITAPHKAVGKFKAAMSRLKIPAPRGL